MATVDPRRINNPYLIAGKILRWWPLYLSQIYANWSSEGQYAAAMNFGWRLWRITLWTPLEGTDIPTNAHQKVKTCGSLSSYANRTILHERAPTVDILLWINYIVPSSSLTSFRPKSHLRGADLNYAASIHCTLPQFDRKLFRFWTILFQIHIPHRSQREIFHVPYHHQQFLAMTVQFRCIFWSKHYSQFTESKQQQLLLLQLQQPLYGPLCVCVCFPGQPRRAGNRRNNHPLTPLKVINHPLSSSSIYHDL